MLCEWKIFAVPWYYIKDCKLLIDETGFETFKDVVQQIIGWAHVCVKILLRWNWRSVGTFLLPYCRPSSLLILSPFICSVGWTSESLISARYWIFDCIRVEAFLDRMTGRYLCLSKHNLIIKIWDLYSVTHGIRTRNGNLHPVGH
jgi:hypothetical protein